LSGTPAPPRPPTRTSGPSCTPRPPAPATRPSSSTPAPPNSRPPTTPAPRWYLRTLGTRHAADRARVALGARGIDLDDPAEQVTAAEWLAAHRADQVDEDTHREIRDDADLTDAERDHASAQVDRPVVETAGPDVRDIATPDVAEAGDPAERHRVPTVDETAATIARAQAALAEVTARQADDALREAEEQARREQLTYWARQDEQAREAEAAAMDGDDMTLGR
jgi:hypothetical protein